MANGNVTLAALEAAHGLLPRTAEVATGGNGQHHYFRAPRGLRSGPIGPGLDLKAEGGYVVAPPSVHRSGQRYNWTRPLPETIDLLPSIPAWVVPNVIPTRSGADRPVDRARSEPILDQRYPHWFPSRLTVGTRQRMLLRLAGWLRGCGYGEDAILAELRTVVASRVEQLPRDSIRDVDITKLAHTMGLKPITRFGLLARYESVAATWKGRAGRTDRHVLRRAVLPIVVRHRKIHGNHEPVPIPSLTVATMADVGDRTASRSLHRLREVRRVLDYAGRRARVEDAHRYRLRPPPAPDSHSDEGLLATPAMRSIALGRYAKIPEWDLYREIFLPRGLGPAAEDVFKALTTDVGQHVVTLSQLAHCHISTAYRVLERMAGLGLVVQCADGWRRITVPRARLVEIAIALGVLGKIAAVKARRQEQRLVYNSPASRKRRHRDAAIRVDLQQRLLALAGTHKWPTMGAVGGEAAWQAYVRRTRTRELWRTLRLLTRDRKPPKATRAAPVEPCVRGATRGRRS